MNDNNGAGAIGSHVLHKLIAKFVCQRCPVEALGRIGVDEYQAGVCISVNRGIDTEEVPSKSPPRCDDAVLDGFEWTNHIGRCAGTRSTYVDISVSMV